MPRKDPEARREYQREFMRQKAAKDKALKMGTKDDFNVIEAKLGTPEKTLDMNSKEVKTLLELAKKSNKKESDMGEEDKFFKYVEKAAEYLPMIAEVGKNLIAGFQSAAIQNQQPQPQQRGPSAPEGWEYMTGLQRLSRKYSQPDWYAAGEAYEMAKTMGSAAFVTPVNTGYVDPNYRQPAQSSEPRNLRDLSKKYPEPPIVSDSAPAAEEVEEAPKKKPEFVKQREQEKEEVKAPDPNVELLNAMREDNNKYIELAFNWLDGLSLEEFKGYVENVEKWKKKIVFLKLLLPIQTKEMLKNTATAEFIEICKEKIKDKYDFLKKEKKLPELKKLFEELKEGL